MTVWALLLVCVLLSISTAVQERVEVTCGQGLVHCEVESGASVCLSEDSHVDISGLNVSLEQCSKQKRWSLCLKVWLNVTVKDEGQSMSADGSIEEEEQREEEQGFVQDDGDNMNAASICVCYDDTSPHKLSKTVHFTFHSSAFEDSRTLKSWISLEVEILEGMLGSLAVVRSPSKNIIKQITIPSKDEVCSQASDAVFCEVEEAPRLDWRTDHVTGDVVLFVADADKWRFQEFSVCQKLERSGSCLRVEWNNTSHEFAMSPSSVAPCLCFKISGNFTSTEYCPFMNEMVLSSSSVVMSLWETQTHERRPALLWTITAPCRLEAQLWLCVKDSPDGGCRVLNDQPHDQIHQSSHWIQTKHRHWRLQGEFLDTRRRPSLCMQVNVSGMDVNLDPVCPFEVRRKHWTFPLILCVLMVCVSVLGVYAVQGTLKSWVFRWMKQTDVNLPVVGGLQLLLLSPPDGSVSQVMCSLSSCLSALGFSVTLDLRSCSEISTLGPVPWLHSGLERVQRCRGRAVLVLTQAGCERAKDWSCGGAERQVQEEERVLVNSGVSSCSEVFDAALNLILADCLLARTHRFLLVQFDEHRPAAALPEFLRGLPMFCLPSQSLDFMTELTRGAHVGQTVMRRWEQASALRAASRALSGALGERTAGHMHRTESDRRSTSLGGWI